MQMTHVALGLTLALLGVTGYLAWEGQLAKRGAIEQLKFERQHQAAQDAARPPASAMVSLPASASISPPPPTDTPTPAPTLAKAPAESELMAGSSALPGGGLTVPKRVTDAEASGINTNTLTVAQKQVLAAKPVAKVKTVVKDQGFIVIDAGSKQQITKGMKLEVRRDSAVLGKATVTDTIEESEAVADLDLASIPVGVTIEPGDEVIQPASR